MKKIKDIYRDANDLCAADIRLLINELVALVYLKSREEYTNETLRGSVLWEKVAPKEKIKKSSSNH